MRAEGEDTRLRLEVEEEELMKNETSFSKHDFARMNRVVDDADESTQELEAESSPEPEEVITVKQIHQKPTAKAAVVGGSMLVIFGMVGAIVSGTFSTINTAPKTTQPQATPSITAQDDEEDIGKLKTKNFLTSQSQELSSLNKHHQVKASKLCDAFDFVYYFSVFLVLPCGVVQASENPSIPTSLYSNGQQELVAPDCSKITWENLPPIQEPGSVQIPKDIATKIGYNPSRFWQAGTRPDSFVMLGDIRDVFHLQAFNLEDISSLSGQALKNLNLNDFGLMRWQTPNSLVRAIPRLGRLPVNQVAPIPDLLKSEVGNISIAQALRQNPTLANTTLGKLDLQHYNLQSIPGLIEAPIGKFASW